MTAPRLRVFLEPTGLHSRAMVRVARALHAHAPRGVQVVRTPRGADMSILHLIDMPDKPLPDGRTYAIIQYCLRSTRCPEPAQWADAWRRSALVWSYYDLDPYAREYGFNFYHAPLGIDDVFAGPTIGPDYRDIVLTTGYVTGPVAEAIEEVWQAASNVGIRCVHIGPSDVSGLTNPASHYGVSCVENIDDDTLAMYYRRARYVAALRHVEGFELPAAEGLACGARPIMFDQPALRRWYGRSPSAPTADGLAIFTPESSGDRLIRTLQSIFTTSYGIPVPAHVRELVLTRFHWPTVARWFWRFLLGTDCYGKTGEDGGGE